jgi:tetratricopeptide (TPR) repeat protein
LEYKRAEEEAEKDKQAPTLSTKAKLPPLNIGHISEYELIRADLNKVITLAPDFVYAYYNRAIILCQQNDYHAAMVDFNKAIEINPLFAEAYFNRGITHIFLGQTQEGLADLSKAGELGLFKAYNIIKRYTDVEE